MPLCQLLYIAHQMLRYRPIYTRRKRTLQIISSPPFCPSKEQVHSCKPVHHGGRWQPLDSSLKYIRPCLLYTFLSIIYIYIYIYMSNKVYTPHIGLYNAYMMQTGLQCAYIHNNYIERRRDKRAVMVAVVGATYIIEILISN